MAKQSFKAQMWRPYFPRLRASNKANPWKMFKDRAKKSANMLSDMRNQKETGLNSKTPTINF